MSQENVEIVQPRSDRRAKAGRTLPERLVVHVPWLLRFVSRAVIAMPPSRLRRVLVTYGLDRAFAAFDRRDWELQATLIHPEVEVKADSRLALSGLDDRRGFGAYVSLMDDWLRAWGQYESQIEEITYPQANQVLASIRFTGQGGHSGVGVSMSQAQVYTLRDGWAVRLAFYGSREEALEAVGLSQQDAHTDS
jgi:hypothetical protein